MRKSTFNDHYSKTIENEQGCWIWRAAKQKDGYGILRSSGKGYLAHRYFYEQMVGPIPRELEIDHLCRNRDCVNPKHLEAVSHEVNMKRGNCKKNGPRIAAFHQTKTHCPHGHPYSGDNLIIRNILGHAPHRECLACKRKSRTKSKKA